jgi:serine phosphatase RsbU (regulator of sigma subunit)
MVKIASDKQPIGKSDNPVSFTSHDIPLQANTVFYLFTDGYADQFGGPNGKKLMSRTFRELLLVNSGLAMPDQKKNLDLTIETWKGNREQVDDILIIGLRV